MLPQLHLTPRHYTTSLHTTTFATPPIRQGLPLPPFVYLANNAPLCAIALTEAFMTPHAQGVIWPCLGEHWLAYEETAAPALHFCELLQLPLVRAFAA